MVRVFVGAALSILGALAEAMAQETTDSARSHPAALPVIGSAPETGFQFGAMGLWVYRRGSTTATRPSQLQLLALATTRSQRRVSVQLDEWSADNSRRLRLRAAYQDFPLPYFGVGGDESEATYTVTGPDLVASLQRRVGEGRYRGAGLRLADARVTEVDLTDWRSEPPVLEGHGSVTVQVFQVRDSRDQVFAPRTGRFGQLTLSGTRSRDHGDVHRYRTGLRIARDARGYRPVGTAGGVLAARVAGDLLVGKAALDMTPMAGADTLLRGYVRGRYRNNFVGAVEAEYRSGHWRRLGYAVFISAGVAAAVTRDDATLLPAAGGGLRYLLAPAERLAVRVDYGWGRNGGGLYIALGEAF
jgi:hypothetical protein